MRVAPTAIEADLQRFYHRRIGEWYRTIRHGSGEMTSRELCALVDELPDDSAFARRTGARWSFQERLLAATTNTLNALRGDYHSVHDGSYHFEPLEMPQLPTVEPDTDRREIATAVMSRLLTGSLRAADIDTTRPIEEALAR